MWRAISSSAWPSLAKAFASARPMPELAPVMTTRESAIAQPPVARDAVVDAGEPQRVPQRRLRRGDHRLAEPVLEPRDHGVRARVEAGHDQRLGAGIPAAHAELEQRVGFRLGQRKAVADAEARAAHDRQARGCEVAML